MRPKRYTAAPGVFLLLAFVSLAACSIRGDSLQASLLTGEISPPVADTDVTAHISPLLRSIGEGGGVAPGQDAELLKELFRTYRSIASFLADIHTLVRDLRPSAIGQTIALDGVTLSLESPREGGVLIETDRFMVTEAMLRDPTAHPKLQVIRRLALTDKTTGEEVYSEEHLPGQLLTGCRGESCVALERAFAESAVLPQSDGLRVARNVNDGLYVLQSADPMARPEAMMADPGLASFLRAEGNYVEPNGIVHATATLPDDPGFGNLWGLHNTGQDLPVGRGSDVPKADGVTDTNAPEAWDIWKGDRNILVCVIDTGINYTLPDLAPNMWTNPGEIPGNGKDDDGNGFTDDVHGYDFFNDDGDPMDDNGHGTHIAGTIGAVGNNGAGVAGVMWKAKIMAIKFLSHHQEKGTLEDAVRAVDYATTMGCSLTSNGWGGMLFEQALYDAIARARDADSLFVAAAGNDKDDSDERPFYPAAYDLPNIISVAAIDALGRLAEYSNWGATSVDLGAPGVQVLGFDDDGSYIWESGTSQATSYVSGIVGLMRSLSPLMPHGAIRDLLFLTVTPTASLLGKTWTSGRANALGALEAMRSGFYPVLTEPEIPGDGFLSPGETMDLPLELTNKGYKMGTDIRVNVIPSNPKVTVVTEQPILYGDIAADASVTKTLRIAIAPDIAVPVDVTFDLTITDIGGNAYARAFTKPVYAVGRISGTITNERYGTPIEGTVISFTGAIAGTDPLRENRGETTSDAGGRYELSIPVGAYTIRARKEDFIHSDPVAVSLPPDRTVDFTLGAPELNARPLSFSFLLPKWGAGTRLLTIGNEAGTSALTYEAATATGGVVRLRSLTHEFDPSGGVAWDGQNLWMAKNFLGNKGNPYPEPAHLMKVDATDGSTLEEIITVNPACTQETNRRRLHKMTVDEESVWATEELPADAKGCYQSDATVQMSAVRISPVTGEIGRRIGVNGHRGGPPAITWYNGMLLMLVTSGDKDRLMEIDPEENTFRLGPSLPDEFQGSATFLNGGIAWDGKTLLAGRTMLTSTDGKLTKVSVELHQFSVDSKLRLTHLLTVDLSPLYTGQDGEGNMLYRRIADIATEGNVLWVHAALPGPPGWKNNLGSQPTTDLLLPSALQPWLSADPLSGRVPYAESRTVKIMADASKVEPGTYDGYLPLLTNDLDELITILPVALTVLPPDAPPTLCLSALLQHRTRRGMTHELSSARLTVTDAVTGTIVKEASLPMNEQGEARLTDTSGIDGSKSYDLTLKPRGHLPLTVTNVTDPFASCHPMGEAKHGDYNETGRIDLSDLITAVNYHVQRENSPHRELFEDIYHFSFGLADIVEVIRNYVQTR